MQDYCCLFTSQISINKKLLSGIDYLKENLSIKETNDITNSRHTQIYCNSEDKCCLINNFNNIDSLNSSNSKHEDNTIKVTEQSNFNLNLMDKFNTDKEEEEKLSLSNVYFQKENNNKNHNKNINDNSQQKDKTLRYNTFVTEKVGKKRGRQLSKNKKRTPRQRKDNLEIKIFNYFFLVFCYLIKILIQEQGREYKINQINKKSKETDSREKRKIFYDKKMGYIFIKSLPRNMKKDMKEKIEKEDNFHNKNVYDKLVADGKFKQSELLNTLLNMDCGEAFYKFMSNDNFVKKYERNIEYFLTFEQYREKKLKGKYTEELINETKNSILKTLTKYQKK